MIKQLLALTTHSLISLLIVLLAVINQVPDAVESLIAHTAEMIAVSTPSAVATVRLSLIARFQRLSKSWLGLLNRRIASICLRRFLIVALLMLHRLR